MRKNRIVTIIAQDPGVRVRGRILTAQIAIPDEELAPGPRGHRIHVVDYDSSTQTLYEPAILSDPDLFTTATDRELLNNPAFHAQNVYAIVTRTLSWFERALGRRIAWSFGGHQMKVAPHAFSDANAFYSRQNEALLFGYFPAVNQRRQIYTCLSHDVVVHETAHALLDGIRPRLTTAPGPDQAGFHEGFADTIAILSVFSLPEIVEVALDRRPVKGRWQLRKSLLLAVAKEIGREIHGNPHCALRQPIHLRPSRTLIHRPDFLIPHRRGEILVAAILNALIDVWERRVRSLGSGRHAIPSRLRVIEEGSAIATHLLMACIRALDYSPPVNLTFGDYLSALLTADFEFSGEDSRLGIRRALRVSFENFGILPTSPGHHREPGLWELYSAELNYSCNHFDSMQRDPEEVYRFLWQNRNSFKLHEHAHLHVESVKPCVRVGSDGFSRQETIAEYVESLVIKAGELMWMNPSIQKPAEMNDSQRITLLGGGVLIFDEHGKMKYHIQNSLSDQTRQSRLLSHLWKIDYFNE